LSAPKSGSKPLRNRNLLENAKITLARVSRFASAEKANDNHREGGKGADPIMRRKEKESLSRKGQ